MTEDEWADEGLLGERSDEDLAWTPTGPAGENPLKGKYRLDWEFEAAKGRFWVGRQLPLGRVVLIKVLGADARAESATEQLRLEAEACAGVTSPHTLALLDFDTTQNGIPFLVFEYVAGLSLAQALRISTRFELTRAVRVVAQVARGLGLLHRRGFIHGDIRLPNLLLLRSAESAQETIKILDFGRVQRIPPVSAEDRASPVQADPDDPPRDPRYLSPEQILRHPPSPSIDIYALGILLFELLSGRPPFGGGGATEDEIRHQQLHTIAPPLGTRVSELAGSDVEELVARCLAKRPEDRPASVLEMREALSDACGILIGGEGEPAGATTMIDDLWVEGPSREPVPPPAPHASLSEDLVLSVETTEGPIPESVYGDDIRFPESVYADEVPTLIQETPDWVTSDEEPTPNADDDVLEERLEGGTSRDGAEAERERTIDEILRAVEELTLQEDAKAAAATPPRSVSSPESPPSDPFGSPVAAASAEAERLPKASTSSAAAPLEDPPPVVEGPHPVIKGAPASDTVETFELPVLPPWSESSPTPPRTSRDPVTRPDGQYFRPRQINTPHVPPHADPSFDEPSPAPPVPPPTPLPQAGTPTPGLRSNAGSA
ncbi:MAG: serine/threonine-protein kinase [Myxococcota bacterium]